MYLLYNYFIFIIPLLLCYIIILTSILYIVGVVDSFLLIHNPPTPVLFRRLHKTTITTTTNTAIIARHNRDRITTTKIYYYHNDGAFIHHQYNENPTTIKKLLSTKTKTTTTTRRATTSTSTKSDHNDDDSAMTMTTATITDNNNNDYQSINNDISTTTTAANNNNNNRSLLNDVQQYEFDEWFRTKIPGSYLDSSILVGKFHNSLRGLIWNDNNSDNNTKKRNVVIKVPIQYVLEGTGNNWDTELAIQLWNEICIGRSSIVYEYCQLLASGIIDIHNNNNTLIIPYYSAAPHTIRHWNDKSKHILQSTKSGIKLLNLHQQQQMIWHNKYNTINTQLLKYPVSWNQFEWLMEVIHSRAYVGIKDTNNDNIVSTIGTIVQRSTIIIAVVLILPLIASITGIFDNMALIDTPVSIALYSMLGIIISILLPYINNNDSNNKKSMTTGVLLPMIDLANHITTADSSIDYDPITRSYQLTIGSKCIVPTTTTTTINENINQNQQLSLSQLYVNYGNKTDNELLLNYGFLPDIIPTSSNDNMNDNDEYHTKLAILFNQRNS